VTEQPGGGWADYYRAVAGREPRDTLLSALAEWGPVDSNDESPLAVDLGCGDGTDTLALVDAGWRVVAVDSSPDFPDHLMSRLPSDSVDRVSVQVADFRSAELPRCHLVHAGFSVYLCAPSDFPLVWRRVRAALLPGAVLSLHLLGRQDSWHDAPGVTTHSRAEVTSLLQGLDVVRIEEQHEDGWSFDGEKHWHRWHVLAREP
jgi:SAM-dependent methyltransferase